MVTYEGTNLDALQYILNEFFGKGSKVELIIGLDDWLTADQVAFFEQHLRTAGVPLTSSVSFGAYEPKGWDNALRIEFENPGIDPDHVGFVWWIPIAIVGGLALIGISGFIGYQVGEVIGAISRAIVPLALIGGGIYLLVQVIKERES